jgi:hypothetical protein
VANRATPRVPDDDHPALQLAVADHSTFAVILAPVFNLDCRSFKDAQGIFKVKTSLSQSLFSLGRIEAQAHLDIVFTKTVGS